MLRKPLKMGPMLYLGFKIGVLTLIEDFLLAEQTLWITLVSILFHQNYFTTDKSSTECVKA